jgi:glycosyltransferase involved in cell wall biosynthesis
MLRLAFFYPSSWMREPIDVKNIWTSPRGLTGSEIACTVYAIELSKLGHEVYIFTSIAENASNVAEFRLYQEWFDKYRHQHWDALCSWMIPEPLKVANPSQFRFFNQQCADLDLCEPGWEAYVDMFAPLSHSHAKNMAGMTSFPKDRWRVLNNGVYTQDFKPSQKTPGKMIWASSHDRGLHWLLEAFPKIKRKVSHANLHIFYNFDGLNKFAQMEAPSTGELAELVYRSKYIKEALRRLEGNGVYAHGSVSRDRIRQEMATAQALAYPCDPVRFTETFGVTVLEACASGAVPVLCTADAFEELWSHPSVPVPSPYCEHKEEFIKNVSRVLSDHLFYERVQRTSIEYAKNFEWSTIAKQLELTLTTRGKEGLPEVRWSNA